MTVQFDTQRDDRGWTVVDLLTRRPVMLGGAPQCGLSFLDADDLAHRLNRRRLSGGRSLL
jgi:hypothetical protein